MVLQKPLHNAFALPVHVNSVYKNRICKLIRCQMITLNLCLLVLHISVVLQFATVMLTFFVHKKFFRTSFCANNHYVANSAEKQNKYECIGVRISFDNKIFLLTWGCYIIKPSYIFPSMKFICTPIILYSLNLVLWTICTVI